MNDKERRPDKIDVDRVLGEGGEEGGAGDPEVELMDESSGAHAGGASAGAVDARAALEEARSERDRYHDQWVRARADFDNFRKRVDRERAEERSQAGAGVVHDILPVMDNLERALASAPEGDPLRDGVALILRQLRETLSRAGLEPIEAVGEVFDPVFHEAVVTERTSRFEPNRVLEEVLPGYMFRGRVLRPALVKVAVAPAEEAGQSGHDDGGSAGRRENGDQAPRGGT